MAAHMIDDALADCFTYLLRRRAARLANQSPSEHDAISYSSLVAENAQSIEAQAKDLPNASNQARQNRPLNLSNGDGNEP